MINDISYTKEWIMEKSVQYARGRRKADPILIEKVTKALHLLEELVLSNLKFIFKGGTSLLLLLDKMHRFSIDIDIIIEDDKSDVDMEVILKNLINRSKIFTHYQEDIRKGKGKVPKAHYKIYYTSTLDKQESYILLDILYEKSHYSKIVEKGIDSNFIKLDKPITKVSTPNIDSILGDKLTAYAPNTTGIPYGEDRELEIIKQLFDVANLFDEIEDIHTVRSTFIKMANQELIYRGKNRKIDYMDVLDDIFQTSKIISARGGIEKEVFSQLQLGVNRIKDYIFSKNYIMESAVNSSAKAAYLSLILKHDRNTIEKYNKDIDMSKEKITHQDFTKLNSIIKFDPEAYFYWLKSIEILTKEGQVALA